MNRNGVSERRRSMVKYLGALGAAGLAPPNFAAENAAMVPLAPGARPAGMPARAIDVHAHFFNASDVSIAGYFAHSVGHSESKPVQKLMKAMQPVLRSVARHAISASAERDKLLAMEAAMKGMEMSARLAYLEAELLGIRARNAEFLYKEMYRFGVGQLYVNEQRKFESRYGAVVTPELFSEDAVRDALDPLRMPASAPGEKGISPKGLLQFVGCMMQARWANLNLYRQAFEPKGIDAVFGAMVDFDHWYADAALSPQRDQMEVQALISRLSGGYMLPLIAYNPWSDILDNGASLELVKEAVEKYGYVGVKIYPPMGFYAYGNADNPVPPPPHMARPNLVDLDRRMRALFDWSAQQGVPVMAHANKSMGRDNASDAFGGPTGWKALLALYQDGQRPPVVNLGHFGGDAKSDWPDRFAETMARPHGERLYGDIGNWSALRDCKRDASQCAAIYGRLASAREKFPQLGERLMYGTDWFMMIMEADWPSYPTDVAAALAGKLGLDLDRLFYKNAIDCFGLGVDGTRRSVVAQHLGSLPAWLA